MIHSHIMLIDHKTKLYVQKSTYKNVRTLTVRAQAQVCGGK